MEQHPVPQNVTTFQFRLIGDMTLKQFGYLAGGSILAYLCYKLPLPFVFTWPLAVLFFLTGVGFAFVPVEERPMDVWVLSFFKSVYSPTLFIWQKGRPAPEPVSSAAQPVIGPRPGPATPAATISPPPAVGVVHKSAQVSIAPQMPVTHVPAPTRVVAAPQRITAFTPVVPPPAPFTARPVPHAAAPAPSLRPVSGVVPPPVPRGPQPSVLPTTRPLAAAAKPRPSLWEMIISLFAPKPKPKIGPHIVLAPATPGGPHRAQLSIPSAPAQPAKPHVAPVAIRSSRKSDPFAWIFDMFQTKHGPVIVPEKVYPDVFAGAPAPESITGKRLSVSGAAPVSSVSAQPQHRLVAEAQTKISTLEDKLSQLQKELQTKSMNEARILELQQQLTELLAQRGKMERELLDLRRKLTTQPFAPLSPAVRPSAATPSKEPVRSTVKVFTAEGALRAGLPRLTTFPNVVTGIVRDGEGNLLPGVLVTVRDKDDVPLRALKTNKLGQFAASTPLPNGTYLMEIEDPRGAYVFDRVQIVINGTVLPPIEIVAKSLKDVAREKLAREIFGQQKL